MYSESDLKRLSKLVFLDLCDSVKGHVFTKAHPDEDAIYVNIKKGSLNFECRICDISEYGKQYSRVDFEDAAREVSALVMRYYRLDILDKYLKNQPTLTLRRNMEKDKIATVKEGYLNESVSNGLGTDQSSSEGV